MSGMSEAHDPPRADTSSVSPSDQVLRAWQLVVRAAAALGRATMLALRAIKGLDFDRAMGKLSDADWKEMSGRLRARAAGLMRQLDARAGYREQIERDVAKRLASAAQAPPAPVRSASVP